MKKFKYQISVDGTLEQLATIAQDLEKIGYEFGLYSGGGGYSRKPSTSHPVLLTAFGGRPSSMGFNQVSHYKDEPIHATGNYDLILALAAMVDDDKFYEGEILQYDKKNLYRYREVGNQIWTDFLDGSKYIAYYCNIDSEQIKDKKWSKADKETITKKFTSMKPYSTTLMGEPAKKIIGWNVKKGVDREAALRSVGFERNKPDIRYEFEVNSAAVRIGKTLGILELLFEPVYEEEKKEVKLECGLIVTITKQGAEVHGRLFEKWQLVNLIDHKTLSNPLHETGFKPAAFFAGCSFQYKVTREEIQKVIDLL